MTSPLRSKSFLFAGFSVHLLILAGCTTGGPTASMEGKKTSFGKVRPILENSCVHCHGTIRLPNMPSFNSTKALASLTGPGKLIVPGAPEMSRFYQVMTLSDDEVGAMPPTGHALKSKEVAIIRQWIVDGAKLPQEDITLTPHGESPRSR
ncbi:MAG: hypothetical protein CFE26_09375 [Verrucomicrobiales bacterium VVV1]|nr:MAG: hypothetical protein CFE26_09375 [Verrucomicrobiales bacterium VVV1]